MMVRIQRQSSASLAQTRFELQDLEHARIGELGSLLLTKSLQKDT